MSASTQPRNDIDRLPYLLVLASGVALTGALLNPAQGWDGVLVAGLWGITIALGAAFFAAVNVLCGARWWDRLRPAAHALAGALAVPAVPLALALLLGLTSLYPWTGEAAHEPLVEAKAAWLNTPLFLGRAALILVLWFVIVHVLRRRMRAVAGDGEESRGALYRASIAFVLLFALTISVAFWDWAMSTEPAWFSSVYGVYGFAGTFQAGIAATAVAAVVLARRARRELAPETTQLTSAMLLAFSMFWAYIWICEYLLIWYSDLPEEAFHYVRRLSGGWSMLFWLNPLLCFVVPFTVLLAAPLRRRPGILLQVAGLVLAGRALDLYLLVAPSVHSSPPAVPWVALTALVAVAAGMVLLVRRALDRWPFDGAPAAEEGPSLTVVDGDSLEAV